MEADKGETVTGVNECNLQIDGSVKQAGSWRACLVSRVIFIQLLQVPLALSFQYSI